MKQFIALLLLIASSPVTAAVEVNSSGGACFPIVADLQRNWIELERHLVAPGSDISRPKGEDFVCVYSAAVQTAMERQVASSTIRCFRPAGAKSLGFCCDNALQYCAQLNPYLFPELLERRQPGDEYEPPKSLWVTPPDENDQWKSN